MIGASKRKALRAGALTRPTGFDGYSGSNSNQAGSRRAVDRSVASANSLRRGKIQPHHRAPFPHTALGFDRVDPHIKPWLKRSNILLQATAG